MSETEFFDELIAVTSSIDQTGRVSPRHFTWRGQPHTIINAGRQWESEAGRHILVETGTGDRFELQLSREDLCWHLVRAWRMAAIG
jgi:hypothetical protein